MLSRHWHLQWLGTPSLCRVQTLAAASSANAHLNWLRYYVPACLGWYGRRIESAKQMLVAATPKLAPSTKLVCVCSAAVHTKVAC